MEFDRDYLALFADRRTARDERLKSLGITDLDAFKVYLRDAEVGNETDTDEYRETQPFKGLTFIADFFSDFRPGMTACKEMLKLTQKWLDSGANITAAYDGAEVLNEILIHCFNFSWEEGKIGLYEPYTDEMLVEMSEEANRE